ncbi:hypothetical protein CIHG_00997 [Coccidioides immitis H538.4]|uniref:Uncharacterized protein n=1 Tax=Coccidioides immitis H538.4 TaxID=396776 RepID=A0A0J8RDE9_COCIT|nr:hypothetical protein CIHG_00997 [Coccidioides immitis H538.4]
MTLLRSWKIHGSARPMGQDSLLLMIRNIPTGACDTMRLDWEPDPPQVCLQKYIREQQALFGFRGQESYILANTNPSKYASYRLHGLSESLARYPFIRTKMWSPNCGPDCYGYGEHTFTIASMDYFIETVVAEVNGD